MTRRKARRTTRIRIRRTSRRRERMARTRRRRRTHVPAQSRKRRRHLRRRKSERRRTWRKKRRRSKPNALPRQTKHSPESTFARGTCFDPLQSDAFHWFPSVTRKCNLPKQTKLLHAVHPSKLVQPVSMATIAKVVNKLQSSLAKVSLVEIKASSMPEPEIHRIFPSGWSIQKWSLGWDSDTWHWHMRHPHDILTIDISVLGKERFYPMAKKS